MDQEALLKLHLEPSKSIEVAELVDALGGLSREFRNFCTSSNLTENAAEGKLLISSVSPGSIDINFLPDLSATAGALIPVMSQLELVRKFAEHIKWLLDGLLSKGDGEIKSEVTVSQCDDATNIVKPIANNGGSQTFTIINGDVNTTVMNISASDARRITNNAARVKSRLKGTVNEIAQRVPLVWKRLDSASAKVEGSSPDKAIIEELDDRPRPVLFTDEMAYLKKSMIEDEEKPFQKVYFVDVQVSRIGDKVVSYRVIGYHGNDDL